MKNKWENTGMAGCGQPLCCIADGEIKPVALSFARWKLLDGFLVDRSDFLSRRPRLVVHWCVPRIVNAAIPSANRVAGFCELIRAR